MTSVSHKFARLALTGASTLALCALAAPAHAQDAAPAEGQASGSSNQILVTATLREQTLQDVPVAVSVLSGDTLTESGVGAIQQLTEVAPSLTFTQGNNENNSSLNIRGIGTSVFSAAVEPSVSVIVDGVVLARAGQGFQDFIDVQRVEVLRGPQSTLFGKNASAGAVSVTSLAPTDYISGKFDMMVTEDDEYVLRGTVSGPIADGLAVRASGFYKDFDGLSRNLYNNETLNGYESYGVKGAVELEASPDVTLTLRGDWRDYHATPTFVPIGDGNAAFAASIAPLDYNRTNKDVNVNGDVFSESPQWGGSLQGDFHLGDYQLTSITAFRDWKFRNNIDVDASPLEDPLPGLRTWDINLGDNHLKQYSQELRLASPDMGGFDFLVGGYAYRLNYDTSFARRWEEISGGRRVNRSAQFNGNTETTNLAVFGNTNVYLGDLTFFGGLRFLYEKVEWSVFRDPANVLVPGDVPFNGPLGTYADFTGSIDDTELVGNIGARYELGSLGNVYASYSRGYKGGGFNLIFAATPDAQPVDPEKVDAFEVGMKISTLDDLLSLNLAAFYTKYKNYQAQAQNLQTLTFELRNAGAISTRGVEAEATVTPTKTTTIRLGATYMDAKIDSFVGGPCYTGQTAAEGCIDNAQDLTGGTLENAPDWRLTGSIRQIVPFGDTSPLEGYVQVNGTYQSQVQFSVNQDPRTIQAGYGIFNASVGVRSVEGNYNVELFVRNLFDVDRPAALSVTSIGGGVLTGQVARDQDRYFGIRAGFNF